MSFLNKRSDQSALSLDPLPNPYPIPDTPYQLAFNSRQHVDPKDILILIHIITTRLFQKADESGSWPHPFRREVLQHPRSPYAFAIIKSIDPHITERQWNTEVILEGLVNIVFYMLREGFRLGSITMTAVSTRGSHQTLGLFGFTRHQFR